MAWIDYKKTYDMVPHLWIMASLDLCGVAEKVQGYAMFRKFSVR